MSSNQDGTRFRNIDALKILAAVFVVILHVDGFASQQFTLSGYGGGARIVYYFLEAISYPAIHLFVMAGSYLMIRRPPKAKSILRIYVQTITITLTGLFICAILFRNSINITNVLKCVFPWTFRAYWFVSEYIVLMIAAPYINKGIDGVSTKRLFFVGCILILVFSVYPFFMGPLNMPDNWGCSYFDLFFVLYIFTEIINRVVNRIKFGYILAAWIMIIGIMVLSTQIIIRIGDGTYGGRELFLYSYKRPFVIASAICIFTMFLKWDFKPTGTGLKLVDLISKCTLMIYLYHMHPIIKLQYTEIGALGWMNVENAGIYLLELLTIVILVYIGGVVLSLVLNKWTDCVVQNIMRSQIFKFFQRRTK